VAAGPIYAAAKGGLVHFMRSIASRLAARGVTAAAVCPQVWRSGSWGGSTVALF
jgi:NAD(P)-dependent dehydrogenase (short-subunit alcohol dehydrogenase family)